MFLNYCIEFTSSTIIYHRFSDVRLIVIVSMWGGKTVWARRQSWKSTSFKCYEEGGGKKGRQESGSADWNVRAEALQRKSRNSRTANRTGNTITGSPKRKRNLCYLWGRMTMKSFRCRPNSSPIWWTMRYCRDMCGGLFSHSKCSSQAHLIKQRASLNYYPALKSLVDAISNSKSHSCCFTRCRIVSNTQQCEGNSANVSYYFISPKKD